MSDLTYQQRSVFERLAQNNEKILQLGSDMKSRTSFIAGASTIIVGIITAAKFLPQSNAGVGVEYLLLSMVCLCSVGIYWKAALIWKGGLTTLPGTNNFEKLYDEYISKDLDVAYSQFLLDLCTTYGANVAENLKLGKHLDCLVWFFITQLSLLGLSVGYTSIWP